MDVGTPSGLLAGSTVPYGARNCPMDQLEKPHSYDGRDRVDESDDSNVPYGAGESHELSSGG